MNTSEEAAEASHFNDPCDYCKHRMLASDEYPCNVCVHATTDMWERAPDVDTQ